jgi:hypothetical protein
MKTISELKTPKHLVTWMIVQQDERHKHWLSVLEIESGEETFTAHTEDYDQAQDTFVLLVRKATVDM